MASHATEGMISTAEFFKKYIDVDSLSDLQNHGVIRVQGEDSFLESEIKNRFRGDGVEVSSLVCKKSGPSAEILDACAGTSLFSPNLCVWISQMSAPSQWSTESQNIWAKILECAKEPGVSVFVQVPQDKRVQWKNLEASLVVAGDIDLAAPAQKLFWMERKVKKQNLKISKERLNFLALCDFETLGDLYNALELWDLGGDVWASRTLGWSASFANPRSEYELGAGLKRWDSSDSNPAYAWVDAVLRGDRKSMLQALNRLEEEGEEPLPLLGLITKSLRILLTLEQGLEPASSEPAFLVQKLKKVSSDWRRQKRPHRGSQLLEKCAVLDLKLKGVLGGVTLKPRPGVMGNARDRFGFIGLARII